MQLDKSSTGKNLKQRGYHSLSVSSNLERTIATEYITTAHAASVVTSAVWSHDLNREE